MKNTKRSLLNSAVALILCFSMLLGSTFAWFTDAVTSSGNVIKTGRLEAGMYWSDELLAADSADWKNAEGVTVFKHQNWEPGFTELKYIKVENLGTLAFKYQLIIEAESALNELADVIDVYYVTELTGEVTSLSGLTKAGTLKEVIEGRKGVDGILNVSGNRVLAIAFHMQEDAGNEYKGKSIGDGFSLRLLATQYTSEGDSFGNDYDSDAQWPSSYKVQGEIIVPVTPTAEGKVPAGGASFTGAENYSAYAPEGVQMVAGASELGLSVKTVTNATANVTLNAKEKLLALDVHVDGVDESNTVPITVTLNGALPKGLNLGNFTSYHVEEGATNAMTMVSSLAELTAHNQFYYDPVTGDVTVNLATFSEIALVADTENAWNGDVATAFAGGTGTEADPYLIANADQLAYLGDLISNDNENYGDKYYKLVADINLGGEENANKGILFYPVGYHKEGGTIAALADDDAPEFVYTPERVGETEADDGGYYKPSSVNALSDEGETKWYTYGGSFKGTFDGNGNTISNIYQNTWQLKGNYEGNYWNAAMGLFGYVNGGTVKNLTVDNFSSDGEFTPTGVIAAYAANSTFENIALTNCNPRVYNTGNGGIVGVGGNSSDPESYKLTFTNITIDNTNKISALWGSWDVACGGLVGMFRGAGHAYMTNCHVAAQIDVYNDVCGNYQYYWYRYSGMMIGTNKNMITDANGYTVPETDKFHAENCTVHFGDWNNYYYCELVANTLASYTHDHQFSRLTEVNSIDVENMTVTLNGTTSPIPTSGRYNYVVVNGEPSTENATCYHFVDGKVWNHEDAGTEVVGGETILKEDRQHYYLPFNQLFTGYGWGVKHIPVYNGEDYAFDGITILDREVADSVEKFETKFTGDFLYRVGNQNTVSIGSLFAAKDGVTVSNSGVWVKVEKVDENSNVSGSFTANTSDWTKGTIQFSGTGVVKVTIQDYNFCTPTTLIVEVVDATNLTSATGTTTGGTFVLLSDVNTTTYVNYWDCTLYGNGFTYSLNGAPTAYNSKQGHGILITKNATLDNLVIVGDIYNSYGAYTTQDYYNSAVDIVGDTTIQNCYISGCAAPISTRANATIVNTTLYGGTVANLIIKSGTVTLKDVTTANYDDGRSLVGMGIVIHSDATESAKLVLNGTLTQYNFISEAKVPNDDYAEKIHETMFASSCSKYHFETSPNRYVNAGIISLTALFNAEDITDNANTGYTGTAVTVSGVNGYVYTQLNTNGSVNNGYDKDNDTHISTTQGTIAPSYSFDYTNKNYVAKQDGSNDYCYEENGKVNISMDEGDTFNWDTSILTATKAGQTLSYTVSMNGVDYTGKSIAFNIIGDYEVVYTYTDYSNFVINEAGNITTYEKTYTKTVSITVAVVEAATKHAEFTFGSSNTTSTTVTIGNNTYVMPNVSATSSTIGSTTVSGKTIYYPIVEIVMSDKKTSHTSAWYAYFPVFSGAVTITDYKDNGLGDAETFGSSTQSMPSGLSIVGDPASLFKYQSSSTAGTSPVVKNNILVYSSPSISAKRSEYNTVIQYSYQDNAGTTYYYYIGYHAPAQSYSPCVTPETLVTMADGSQKEIQNVKADDKFVVWNFRTGKYEEAYASIIMNHGFANVDVVTLNFANGKTVNTINGHGFFDAETREFVLINKYNVAELVGREFVAMDGDGYATTTLVSYTVEERYTEVWSLLTAEHYNCILEGMWTITAAEVEDSPKWLMPFEITEDMTYDEELMNADIEKYGLYTYEEFAEYCTREQFDALGIAYFKVSVGKGYFTYEDIIYLLSIHIG